MSVIGPPPNLSLSPTRALTVPNCNRSFTLLDYTPLLSHSRSFLTDGNIVMDNLTSTLFPGIDSSVQVHRGFAKAHAKTAPIILNQVKFLISRHGATSVTLACVSHFHPHLALILYRLVTPSEERSQNLTVCSWPSIYHPTSPSKVLPMALLVSVTLHGPLSSMRPFIFPSSPSQSNSISILSTALQLSADK